MLPFLRVTPTKRLTGAAFLSASQAILLALGYVTHVVVGKIGGPPLYGVYGVVLSILTIVNMLLTLGIPVAASKETAEDPENSGGVFLSALRLQCAFSRLLSGLVLVAAGPLAAALGDAKLTPLIRFTAVIYPATALYALFSNYFNGLHGFGAQAQLTVIYAVAKLAGSVGFLLAFRTVWGALSGFVIGGAAAALVGAVQAAPTIRAHVRATVPPRRLFLFAGAFVGTSIALQLLMSLDLFLVKRLLHDDALAGYYNAATTVARIPYFILQGLGFVFLPSVARLFKEDADAARRFIREVFRYLFLLLLPITALSATTSKVLIHAFFSRAYTPGAQPLTFLAIALGLLSAFYLLATIAAGAGKPRVPLVISWGLIPLTGAIGVALIPRFHLVGAAWTTVTSALIGAILIGGYMHLRFRLTFPVSTLVRGGLATVVAVLPTYAFPSPPTLALPFWYALLLLVYVLSLVALGELRAGDWQRVRELLPKRSTPEAASI